MSQHTSNEPPGTALDTHLIPGSSLVEPVIAKGSGCEVVDEAGNTYLDLEAGPGVNSVGHCHPKVVAAIQHQATRLLQGPGRNHSRMTSELAARITRTTDGRLSRVFFTNSGAESNDGAIKLAFKHATNTGKKGYGVIAMEHSFHGRTSLALTLTGNAGRKKGFGPYAALPGVVHAMAPYCYRCPYSRENKNNDGGCGLKCANSIEDAIKVRMQSAPAVLISESVLCVGGVLPPPRNYWPRVQEICRKYNITLIVDEVFAGWGRSGKTFAHQHWDVQPDIVTFAKAIGGGVPLGGFMATEEVGTAFEEGDHFTTFGSNNQIGMAAGHAVLDILEEENLAENARICGEYFLEGLKRLAEKYDVIGDVRGIGLMIGIELVKNRETREPHPDFVKAMHTALRERKIMISTTGTYASTLRITPPLIITRDQIDHALRVFDETFAALRRA